MRNVYVRDGNIPQRHGALTSVWHIEIGLRCLRWSEIVFPAALVTGDGRVVMCKLGLRQGGHASLT